MEIQISRDLVVISVIITLMLLKGKSYYTQGIFPFLIAAGAVSWENMLRKTWSRIIMLVLLDITFITGTADWNTSIQNRKACSLLQEDLAPDYGMDFVCRFEDNTIHSLPQDYADMLGWEELAGIA